MASANLGDRREKQEKSFFYKQRSTPTRIFSRPFTTGQNNLFQHRFLWDTTNDPPSAVLIDHLIHLLISSNNFCMQKEKALIPTARWRVFRNPGKVRELCQTLQRKLQPECVVESISRSQRAGIHLPHDGNEFCGNKNLSVLNLRKEGGALGFQQLKKMNSCPNKYDWGPTHRQNTFCNMSGRGKRHKVLVKCPILNLSREEGSRFPSARAREFKSWINMCMSVKKPQ